jgi:nucleoside-diphosphate-sugar epimerase
VTAVCVKEPWRLRDVAQGSRLTIHEGVARRWWEADFLPTLAELLEGADALVLLAYEPAGATGERERLQHELDVNAAGARRIAETAFENGLSVVFASSADVYGPKHDRPVSELEAPRPVSAYGRAKLEAERLIAAAGGPRFAALRIATVFGPGENGPRAIPAFVRAFHAHRSPVVHGDGSDVRDYVHVGDVAAAVVNASLLVRETRGEELVLNVGSGRGRTTTDVLAAVAETMGVVPSARYEPSTRPPSRLVLDMTRAVDVLGIRPRDDFQTALGEEVAWLRDHLGGTPSGPADASAGGVTSP